MKKAEELKLYAPEPKRPELDAALCMSVAEGQGVGRYIKGKVLTVAVWDKKEKPLVVWRFFGGYWTGELRGNKNPKKNELSPRQIEVKPCQCLTWRTEVPATKGESELLQNYFDDRRPGYLIGIVEDALSAHAKKKREERNARQAAETQKLFENLPEPPEDFSKQVLKVCSDAGFLWVTNDRQGAIEPGGVEKKILIQRARCDSCGGEYDEYEHSTRINLRAKTYFGVFGLNRQELAVVARSKKSFREVDDALRWKEAGLAINDKNMKMTANIRNLSGMAKTLQKYGMTRSLKYLRQQTRRVTGKYDGHIALRVAQDWSDYLDMAKKAGMNMRLESVMFPLDLKRRHDDLVLERNKQHRMEAMKGTQHSIRREAEQLEKQFHIENIYKKIRKIYEYDGAEYIIRVPEGAKDILQESKFLDHCIQRGTRYFERISVRESYIFFLRKKSDPNTPWYTLEVEPGGTVRQKRSYSNDQYADLEDAKPFIEEWQQVVQGRMTASEISFAKQSKEIRAQEFAELKENGNIIRTGANAGKLLVDELMHDLMEVEKRVG